MRLTKIDQCGKELVRNTRQDAAVCISQALIATSFTYRYGILLVVYFVMHVAIDARLYTYGSVLHWSGDRGHNRRLSKYVQVQPRVIDDMGLRHDSHVPL